MKGRKKYRYIILSSLLGLITSWGFAQESIVDAKVKKIGIYRSYEEFATNNPGITSFDHVQSQYFKQYFKTKDSTYVYKLHIQTNDSVDIKNIWGLCNGKDVYVMEHSYAKNFYFFKLDSIQRYAYYAFCEYPNIVSAITSGGAGMVYGLAAVAVNTVAYTTLTSGKKLYRQEMFINMNNGHKFNLTYDAVKLILKKDQALYNDFMADSKANKKLRYYLSQYNASHSEELKK